MFYVEQNQIRRLSGGSAQTVIILEVTIVGR